MVLHLQTETRGPLSDPHSWVYRDVRARRSISGENDAFMLLDFQHLVGVDRREEWDLLGIPHGVSVCSLITHDPKFFIYSAMVTEAGICPPFTPFSAKISSGPESLPLADLSLRVGFSVGL